MAGPKWFKDLTTNTPSEQGIIIDDFEWFDFKSLSLIRNTDGSAKELPTLKHNVIILTQSCDLIKPNTKYVHVCPVYTLADFLQSQNATDKDRKAELFDQLARNSIVSKHLTNTFKLDSNQNLKGDYLVIDFSKASIVPMVYIKSIMNSRGNDNTYPMLNIPYRESMAQRYGQFFSRVGNPINLDKFDRSIHAR